MFPGVQPPIAKHGALTQLKVSGWESELRAELEANGYSARLNSYCGGLEKMWYCWELSVFRRDGGTIEIPHDVMVCDADLDVIEQPKAWLQTQIRAGWLKLRDQVRAVEEVWWLPDGTAL